MHAVADRANPTRTRFHPSGAPVAAGAVLLCQSHGCFYFPRWRSPCRPGLSRSQHTAHRGRTAFAASPAAGAHRALRDRCCCSARRSLARRWRRGALRCCHTRRCPRTPPTVDPWLVRTRAFSRGARSVTPRAQRAARLHTLVLSRLAAPRSGVRVGRAALPRAFTVTSQCARSPHMTRTGEHPPPLPRRPTHIPTRAPRAPSAQIAAHAHRRCARAGRWRRRAVVESVAIR